MSFVGVNKCWILGGGGAGNFEPEYLGFAHEWAHNLRLTEPLAGAINQRLSDV